MITETEKQIGQARKDFHRGKITAVELVEKVTSAGRKEKESERQRLLEKLRRVLGDSNQMHAAT